MAEFAESDMSKYAIVGYRLWRIRVKYDMGYTSRIHYYIIDELNCRLKQMYFSITNLTRYEGGLQINFDDESSYDDFLTHIQSTSLKLLNQDITIRCNLRNYIDAAHPDKIINSDNNIVTYTADPLCPVIVMTYLQQIISQLEDGQIIN